jgi:hypothetical protein
VDDADRMLFTAALAGLSIAIILLAHAMKDLQEDMGLLRITAAVPESERDS